ASRRYCGTARVMPGSSTPARIAEYQIFLPGKENFASAYPAMVDTSVDSRAPPPAYRRLLPAHSRNWPAPEANRSLRLSASEVPGAKVKVVNSSEFDFVDAMITQATGTRQYSAPPRRRRVASSGRRAERGARCAGRVGAAGAGASAVRAVMLTRLLRRRCAG